MVEQIRDLIITDKLGLGEQLSEQALAEQLGVSRTPVREAFLRLQTERLVEVKPQRGTFVFQYDTTELREICELRSVLEPGALRIAIKRDRDAVIKALARAVAGGRGRSSSRGPAAYQPYDTAFHETLVLASGNRELIAAYEKIAGRIRAIRFRLTRTMEQIQGSQRDHGLVVERARRRQRCRGRGRARAPCLQWLLGPGQDARAGAERSRGQGRGARGGTMKITKVRIRRLTGTMATEARCGRSGWSVRSTSTPSTASRVSGKAASRSTPTTSG